MAIFMDFYYFKDQDKSDDDAGGDLLNFSQWAKIAKLTLRMLFKPKVNETRKFK